MFKVVEIKGIDNLLKGLEGLARAPERVHGALMKTGMVVQANARANLDLKGTTNTGRLSQSIEVEDRPFEKTVIVGTNVHYAPYVEFGTRPHMPPVEPLVEWAHLKLHDDKVGYAIAKAIAKRGTKPKPFMRPAVRVGQQFFGQYVRRVFMK